MLSRESLRPGLQGHRGWQSWTVLAIRKSGAVEVYISESQSRIRFESCAAFALWCQGTATQPGVIYERSLSPLWDGREVYQ